jgi:hypothetical protein
LPRWFSTDGKGAEQEVHLIPLVQQQIRGRDGVEEQYETEHENTRAVAGENKRVQGKEDETE